MEKGNIIIPQDVQKKEIAAQTQGVIVAIGPRAWTDKGDQASKCEVGDKVMFTRYSGLAIDPDDSYSHILINDRDILGLVDE
jgi:co-chaperonin GroES (HSP10)